MGPGQPPFDFRTWFGRHTKEITRPIVDAVLKALKNDGVTKIAATGYCFGARYVFDLAFDGLIAVSVVSHPTGLSAPDDFNKYLATATAPLLINSCPIDQQFPMEAAAQADAVLGDGKFAPGYKRVHWDGCTHGFAVRGDLNDPKVKAGKEGAFKEAIEWFNARL
ncbi:Dienelactone hydrolase endo-1,3,1,4-beta-D-glucanase [Mycena kentingensis (nom. inval.)]|nr:Dienelactone hydrolase endo-1,3,1,4-beta-D-glucanase [Mycena kentingensis (nom. inval.)]